MIRKLGSSPSFTSRVKVLYNNNYGLKDFYSSTKAVEEIDNLRTNGNNDVVTLIPVPGRYEKRPLMKVQVVQYLGDNFKYSYGYAYEPEEIISAYKQAKSNLNKNIDTHEFRKDINFEILHNLL